MPHPEHLPHHPEHHRPSSFLAFDAPAAKGADGKRIDGTVEDPKYLTTGLEVVGNLADGGGYVISGSGMSPGLSTLLTLAPGFQWVTNTIEASPDRVVKMPEGTEMIPSGWLAGSLDANYEAQKVYAGTGAPKGLMALLEGVRAGR
jgi:hypothetical protein